MKAIARILNFIVRLFEKLNLNTSFFDAIFSIKIPGYFKLLTDKKKEIVIDLVRKTEQPYAALRLIEELGEDITSDELSSLVSIMILHGSRETLHNCLYYMIVVFKLNMNTNIDVYLQLNRVVDRYVQKGGDRRMLMHFEMKSIMS